MHEEWLTTRPDEYANVTRRRLLPGLFLPAVDYMHASRRRKQLIAAIEAAFDEVDVLLTASSMDPACRIDDTEAVERTYPRQAQQGRQFPGPAQQSPHDAPGRRRPIRIQPDSGGLGQSLLGSIRHRAQHGERQAA